MNNIEDNFPLKSSDHKKYLLHLLLLDPEEMEEIFTKEKVKIWFFLSINDEIMKMSLKTKLTVDYEQHLQHLKLASFQLIKWKTKLN